VITFNQTTFAEEKLHEESVWNYETGFKGATASRRIQYGVSVFQYYYDHFQTERITAGTTQPFDGGRARGQGLEVTLQGSVNEHLSVFASYGFTDTRFAARGDDGEPQAFAGNSFRLTSRHAISFGGTVLIPAGDRGSVFITPVVQYRSEQFFEDDNANLGGTAINPALPAYMLRQGGFTIVNLRVGYRPRHGRWEVAAYVNNLLDKDYLIDAGNTGLQFGLPTSTRGAPRIAGLQATARF
jgi:outer membrane receptor protein involved in Fe transport